MYTASLYAGLASLIHTQAAKLEGCHILMFAFGSGVMAAMFVIHGRRPVSSPFTLARISKQVQHALHVLILLDIGDSMKGEPLNLGIYNY